jgi:hypothetical protein
MPNYCELLSFEILYHPGVLILTWLQPGDVRPLNRRTRFNGLPLVAALNSTTVR